MKWLFVLVSCVCIFLTVPLFSQSTRPSVAKEPSWIIKNEIDYSKTSLDKDATEGSLDIYFEAQISLAEHCRYIRQCKKLISKAGVQNESTVSVSFDPTYQQLIFHSIQIIRNGERLNRLQLSKIKTLHQEEELESFIYNGTLDAVLILEDTRQGDIIEYSYSVKGFNPVFNNKFATSFSTGFSVPVYDLFYRVVVPKGRSIDIKYTNEKAEPVITELNGQQIYEWRKSNIAPITMQDFTPSWYNPYPGFEISEYKNWKEVNDCAMELFPTKKILSAALQKKIAEISTTYTTEAAKVKAALLFVQDDIRYMGIELGKYSHKPADPSKVFAQRFGDCKEKSYLLCCMLNAMNIESNPVLINTTSKKELYNMLPSPINFDHATVRVKIDNGYYYFDPTIAYQRGNIKEIFYPDYQAGLVIDETTSQLTEIKFRNISYQHIDDYFKVDRMSGSGSLVVTTTYKGDEADGIRSNFNNQSVAEILTSNKKFYSKFYEEIKGDSLTYADNDSTGIFTTTEYYTIPEFWTIGKGAEKSFSFSAFTIAGAIRRPKEKDRRMPVGIQYPVSYQEEVTIVLPLEWDVTATESHLKNKGFVYNAKFSGAYKQVHLTANYTSQKDYVNTDEVREYLASIKEYDNKENYILTSTGESSVSAQKTDNSTAIISIIIIMIGVVISIAMMKRR